MTQQIKSVKSVPVHPMNLNVTTEVHPAVKRFAELSCSVYVLGISYEMYVSKDLWEDSVSTLAQEMVNLLMKLASCVKENVDLMNGFHIETTDVHSEQLSLCGGRVRGTSSERGSELAMAK